GPCGADGRDSPSRRRHGAGDRTGLQDDPRGARILRSWPSRETRDRRLEQERCDRPLRASAQTARAREGGGAERARHVGGERRRGGRRARCAFARCRGVADERPAQGRAATELGAMTTNRRVAIGEWRVVFYSLFAMRYSPEGWT